MFGAWIRAGITTTAVALVGAVLRFFLPYVQPYLGQKDELLYQSFNVLGNNVVLLGLIAVGAGVLAAATAESSAGRVR